MNEEIPTVTIPEEEDVRTQEQAKKPKWKLWLGIAIGTAFLAVGGFSVFQSELVNNIFVEMGANQVATNTIELTPASKQVFVTIADTIDAAVQARNSDPKILCQLITTAIAPYAGVVRVEPIMELVINQVNTVYKAGETEELYTAKLICVARGFRSAAKEAESE